MSIVSPRGKCLSKKELEAYVNNQLSKEKRLRVEHHLLDCDLCSASVEGMNYLQSKNLDTALGQRSSRRNFILWIIIGIILLVIGFVFFNQSTVSSSKQIENEIIAFESQLNFSIKRGKAKKAEVVAYQNFRSKDFENTLAALEKIEYDLPNNANLLLLSAYSNMRTDNLAKAKEQSLQLYNQFPFLKEEANMIQAFIHLKENNNTKAKEKLKDVIKNGEDSITQSSAKKIIKLLD